MLGSKLEWNHMEAAWDHGVPDPGNQYFSDLVHLNVTCLQPTDTHIGWTRERGPVTEADPVKEGFDSSSNHGSAGPSLSSSPEASVSEPWG